MNQRARRILGEAFATLDRTADIPTPDDELDPDLDEFIESSLEPDWTPPAPRVRRKRDTVVQQAAGEEWNTWMDKRLADALDRFSDAYSDALINVVFKRIDRAKGEADARANELEATIRELRGEVTVLREMTKSGGNVHIPGSSSHKVIVN
jgi:hypothetical protein